MEDDKDFLFENFTLAIFFGESDEPTLEDVHPPPVNLQRHSTIAAGHARVIPEYHFEAAEDVFPADMPLDESTVPDDEHLQPLLNPVGLSNVAGCECRSPENSPEAAQEAYSTQECHHECEQPAVAEGLRQELGQPQDDRQPEPKFQETVLQRGINCLGLSYVAGNETTSPENPPEAAQEACSTQEYYHEREQPAAAEGLRQELGQPQDDRQPEQEIQETVLQRGINCLGLSYVAGNETTSPENPPEAAQEACSTQEYHHEREQPAAAESLRQELGQPQDDRQPDQEFQKTVLQPRINKLTICHCQSQQNPEESLQLYQQKDESQLAEVTKNSDDDLNGVYSEHSEGDYMHNIEVGDEPSVVNFFGVEPLHQELDQADYSHHLVLSDTQFFSLGDPGDDGDLFLMQISMDIFD